MPAASVRNTIVQYLSLVEKEGLVYERPSWMDAQKKKEMKKKAETLFASFLADCAYADEPVQGRGRNKEQAEVMAAMIRSSLCDVICAMKRKSGEEYRVANDYLAYLRERYGIKAEPFSRQLTPLERQLSIAKDLHDFDQAREFDRHDVAEKYLVSDRTIDNDLAALHEGISVMDQKLVLDDFRLKNRRVTAVSTMHPLFLAQNLTQVICMLEGLRRMEEHWTLRDYAHTTAVSIWCQLSDYARDRILHVLTELMDLDKAWYERLDAAAENRKERMFFNEPGVGGRSAQLMYAFKGGLRCTVSYIAADDSRQEACGRIVDLNRTGLELLPENGEEPLRIEQDRILEAEVATELR